MRDALHTGQLFSAPMDWRNIIDQLQLADLWRDTRTHTAEYPASVEASRQRAMHAELTEMREAENTSRSQSREPF